ncbi:MAG: sensor histidine kinase [Gammaproteobacteria bacterium]|nr:histidine kinase [Gammaproteobacteria bacterium]MXY91066.1 sensor histidine kinase [Gammaproteobacteria bacterium]MYA37781.1 sensor histidine kinase [Gammaproteobacteria bacterium]MYA67798.1 sensor histidine kinase [Gammaproteobacteria bacterium]MYC61035.1 sensor histidine kinase [Gammaproteobacteria bacterium]
MRLISFLHVGLFSLAIAVLVWWLIEAGSFLQVVVVSLSIGWSVNLAFVLGHDRLIQWIGPWLAPAPVVALGLTLGLLLAGTFVTGQPLMFFSQDFSTLALGLFFGITGFLIFSARERLRRTGQLLADAELKQSQQEKLLAETELKLMQAQIEPHFLFNTLSNITQLIRSNPDLAVETLENLTTLLRGSLARTRSSESTLSQEIDFAEAYLAIQATRMQGRLRYQLDLPEELREIPVPPLLIQPLLENAVLHGIATDPEGGEVSFTARRIDDELILGVSDTGVGIGETGAANGTGLRNVRDRLRLRYGPEAALELTPASPRGVNALISIPLAKS